MKKTIFTLAIILSIAIASQAQVDIKPTFGLNSTHLTSDPNNWKSETRIGYQFGVSVLVGDKFYVEPGVYWYTVTKDLVSKTDPEHTTSFKNTINSIRIPVKVGYHIFGSEESLADLRIFAGVAGSFVTSVKNDTDELNKENFNKMLFDVNAGIGVDVWIFFAEIDYVFGLTPVFKNDEINGHHNDGKLQAIDFNLGIRIKL